MESHRRCARQQRSLLLLTAHRAKGLEFDDLVILNGGWDKPSEGEDIDAPRRLFYVAMTRARRSLAIVADRRHPFVPPASEHVLRRPAPATATTAAGVASIYQMPDLKTVDLSWAGRLGAGHAALAAIAGAKVGDAVTIVREAQAWMVLDSQRRPLGRMAKKWSPPQRLTFLRGEIGAIVRWHKVDSGEDYHGYLRRDEWEVIVPELVFG